MSSTTFIEESIIKELYSVLNKGETWQDPQSSTLTDALAKGVLDPKRSPEIIDGHSIWFTTDGSQYAFSESEYTPNDFVGPVKPSTEVKKPIYIAVDIHQERELLER